MNYCKSKQTGALEDWISKPDMFISFNLNLSQNSHKLCNDTGYPTVSLFESQWTTTSEFSNGGKSIVEQILVSEEINQSKRAGL